MHDSDQAAYPITCNKEKEPVIPADVDTPVDDELSSSNSLPLGLSPIKNTRAKSHKRTLHCLAFSDAVSDASHRARKEAGRG